MSKIFNFKSYFKFLSRNKTYTIINIFGLSISLMFVIVIGIYTQQEYAVDDMHSKAERIYSLGYVEKGIDAEGAHHEIQPKLLERYPEIETTCAVTSSYLQLTLPTTEKMLAKVYYVDSTFYRLFDFELTEGNRCTVLRDKNSAVITEELAKKMFGNADPVGKPITCQYSGMHLIVTGVCKKMKGSSVGRDIDMLVRFEQVKYYNPSLLGDSMSCAAGASVFILTKPNTDLTTKTKDMSAYFKTFWWIYQMKDCAESAVLLPLKTLYFLKSYGCGVTSRGDKKLVNILFSVGLVILIFSIMNYINLTVSQSGFRAREMAIRRLLGSQRKEIITRLILESILLCFISLLIALAFSFSLAALAGKILDTELMMQNIFHPFNLILLLLFVLIVGALSGIVPAVIISAAKPIEVVRGTFRRRTKMVFSKVFITFQNVITIVMIAVSITMVWQIHHLISAPLGYTTKGIIDIMNPGADSTKVSTFIEELRNLSCVERASTCQGTPLNYGNNQTMNYQGKTISFQTFIGDTAYISILGLKLKQDNRTANMPKHYFNRQAFTEHGLNLNAPSMPFFDNNIPVDGVIEDFHIGTIIAPQHPLHIIIENAISNPWEFLVQIKGDPAEAYRQVQTVYKKVFDEDLDEDHPFLDQQIEHGFESETRISNIVSLFAFIAILISLLGLIAMSTYFIQQRRREIAVRKVFGSTSAQIWSQLVKTFITYVGIAFVIAIPIIYYSMNNWLSGYSYRISLSPIIYIIAGLFCLIISFIAVFIQSYQASNANPVDSIKDN
jgi:putative ABC transport system permease protein